MKKVLVFGTFDNLHKGHLSFLWQARKHGKLTVVVTRDSSVKKTKGRKPIQNERRRVAALKKFAGRVLLGERRTTYNLIKKIKPDVICIGYDQKPSVREARKILKRIGMEKVKLRKMRAYKPHLYKSSRLNELR